MPSRRTLIARRCNRDVIAIFEQVPSRAAFRWPMALDDASAGALLLWTVLRWERTFVLTCLEDLGVDMWRLTCDVDSLLRRWRVEPVPGGWWPQRAHPQSRELRFELDGHFVPWLDRAAAMAAAMDDSLLGTEHLLLAVVLHAPEPLASLLARHGITYERVKDALESVVRAETIRPDDVDRESVVPWGARWDTSAAIGVPRRFGVGILLLLTAMSAVLFAAMELLGAATEVFVVVAVLFAGVALGQILLFGGRYPRAASVWVGACLFPLETLALIIYSMSTQRRPGAFLDQACGLLVFSIPIGAALGYLAGGLTAGAFLLLERYAKWRRKRTADEGEEEDAAEPPAE